MDIRVKNFLEEQASKIKSYYPQPMYYIQVNKQACRVLVSVNHILLGNQFTEDCGETMLLPVNAYIGGSGHFAYEIAVLPMKGKEYLIAHAWVEAKIYYLDSEEKPLSEMIQLGETLRLPPEIDDKKLSVYRASSHFTATLPFDYTYRLNRARNLSTISGLEQKVVEYYNKIRQWMADGDLYSYLKERGELLWIKGEMGYMAKEDFAEGAIGSPACFNTESFIDRQVMPVQGYEMYICGNGKLVQLRSKDDLDSILRVTYFRTEERKQNNQRTTTLKHIMLYMPEGSDELKMFY